MTLKAAVNWRDCYKNIWQAFFDYSNWFGPKALWIDFCDFHTSEDLLLYTYSPPGLNKDTGDVTLLQRTIKANNWDYDGSVAPVGGKTVRRPSSS